jgi:integrase
MARIYRPSHKDKDGKRVAISKYWLRFRDHNGTTRLFAGFSDKTLTQKLGYKLEQLAIYRRSHEPLTNELRELIEGLSPKDRDKLITWGLVDHKMSSAGKSLSEHIEDFKEFIAAKSEKRAEAVTQKVNRVVEGCGFQTYSDIQPSKVTSYLKSMRDSGSSVRTTNHHLQAIKQFANWMVMDGRASESPVRFLKAHRVLSTDIVHQRRVLEIEEIKRLLDTTRDSKVILYGMSGYQRYLLYKLAIETGLRRNELRSLIVGSFDFGACTVFVIDAYSKNRKQTVLPLRPETAKELQVFLSNKTPATKVFGGSYSRLTCHTSKMLQADLAKAGIEYEDDAGRVFDFHCLRHETGTLLADAGVNPKTAQSIMRHSDINLTMSLYTHTLRGAESEAISKLPNLSGTASSKDSKVV